MIELIFVIVILGILAAVAIPRLAATRDDAEVSKAVTNATTLLSDVGSYYTSQGEFASSMQKMTNVQLAAGSSGKTAVINVAGEKCITLKLIDAVTGAGSQKPAHFTISVETAPSKNACKTVVASKAVVDLQKSKFTYTTTTASGVVSSAKTASGIPVSGINVVF